MNKKEVNLTIDSRIISHLGEALIDNEKIALLELIKNASDADANYCNIEIDTLYQSEHGQGRIIIEDDGNGMTPYIIENAFLKIATSFKSNHQKVSPKFKRQAQSLQCMLILARRDKRIQRGRKQWSMDSTLYRLA